MPDLIQAFVAETTEWLEQVERDLHALRDGAVDEDLVGRLFRTFHSVKGNAGWCAFPRIEALAHATETLLAAMRDGTREADAEVVGGLFAATDSLRALVEQVATNGIEPPAEGPREQQVLANLAALRTPTRAAHPDIGNDTPPAPLPDGTETKLWIGLESSVRIDVGVLDGLLEQAQRLSLLGVRLARHAGGHPQDTALNRLAQSIATASEALEQLTLQARMQPIGTVWDKYPRLARRIQAATGKLFDLSIQGRETPLDRTMLEALKDPMTHIVRNALVHGIETPSARVQAGKRPVGRVWLRAYEENRFVHVEIADDGAGIDPDRARARAVEMGLMSESAAHALTHMDAVNLVFLPGFSLTTEVTRLSGRGVGLDVVKNGLERVGGSFHIESQVGGGTTFCLRVPAALTYQETLLFAWRGRRYAVPEGRLLEIVRASGATDPRSLESVRGIAHYSLRGNRLPVIAPPGASDTSGGWEYIIVLQGADLPFGVLADSINGSEKLTVRPLPDNASPGLVGTASRGDDEVTWVIDPTELARTLGAAATTPTPRRTTGVEKRASAMRPPRTPPSARAAPPASHSNTRAASPRRALIVDDSSVMRARMRRMLSDLGFEITEAANGRLALEQLAAMNGADLVMCDWNMPEMNGLEFIRAVRADKRYKDLPVMMVSTEADRRKVSEALEAGADDYIRKPFTPSVIAKKVGLIGWLAE